MGHGGMSRLIRPILAGLRPGCRPIMTGTGGIQVGQGPCDHLCQRRAAAAGVPQWRRHDGQLSRAGRARRAAAHRYTDATSHSVFGVMGPQNCATVHQAAQIPGSGVFLPSLLLKRLRSGAEMSYLLVTAAKSRGSAGMGQQLPKLIVRVRFPSPAPSAKAQVITGFSVCPLATPESFRPA